MKVKDLVAYLQTLDQEMPVMFHAGMGGYYSLDQQDIMVEKMMRHKIETDYVVVSSEHIWKSSRDQFDTPFDALIVS